MSSAWTFVSSKFVKTSWKHRRARWILCLLTAILAISFVAWDAAVVQGAETQASSPAYLVAWLAVAASGAAALLLLALIVLARAIRRLSRSLRSGAAEEDGALPAGEMLPRF